MIPKRFTKTSGEAAPMPLFIIQALFLFSGLRFSGWQKLKI